MKKKVLIVLFSVFVAGFYAQAQAQKINVVSVSKERDIHNFYTMMKEPFHWLTMTRQLHALFSSMTTKILFSVSGDTFSCQEFTTLTA